MQKLLDEAKAQTASMLASGAFSEETGDAEMVFGEVEDADRNFTNEADAKIAAMRDRMSADDSAKGVEREEDHAKVQADQLTNMLEVTGDDIRAKAGSVQTNLTAAQDQHALDARRLQADLDAAKTSANTILSDAAGRSRETLDGIAEKVQQ